MSFLLCNWPKNMNQLKLETDLSLKINHFYFIILCYHFDSRCVFLLTFKHFLMCYIQVIDEWTTQIQSRIGKIFWISFDRFYSRNATQKTALTKVRSESDMSKLYLTHKRSWWLNNLLINHCSAYKLRFFKRRCLGFMPELELTSCLHGC